MSLTEFLGLKDVKTKFLELFPKPPFTIKHEILAPPLTTNYPLVGTAFDYLLRFFLEYSYDQIKSNHWIAENSLEILGKLVEVIQNYREKELPKDLQQILSRLFSLIDKDFNTKNNNQKVEIVKEWYKKVKILIMEAKKNHNKFLSNGEITESLIESTIKLAQADIIYRAGIIDKNLSKINKDDVTDLRNLISLVDLNDFKPKYRLYLNPSFGIASEMLGGADADLIIDDTIIEIKTTKKLEMRRDYYNQLIGYYTLYRIAGINGKPENIDIKKLGIYFSRHGYLHLYDTEDIIDEAKFTEFIEWFKERASQEYGELSQNI